MICDLKDSEGKKSLPAAALAGLAQTAAGASWPGVLAACVGAALLGKWRREETLPRWLRAVQALWSAFVLCQGMRWAGESWRETGSEIWIGLILLLLALWFARKGRQSVQAAAGVLGLVEAGLLAAVLLGSVREIRLENLLPRWELPDGWLLAVLLLPGNGQGRGWLWALPFSLVTAGAGWRGEGAFLQMSRSVSGIGSVRRLESLAMVGLALGLFLMMAELLSQEHPEDQVWSLLLAAGLYLSGFCVNGWIAALCAAAVWYVLPSLYRQRKK